MKKINHVVIVLDESGSMSYVRNKTVKVVNKLIEDLETQAENSKIETRLTLIKFNTSNKVVFEGANVREGRRLNEFDFIPNSGTALLDAVDRAVSNLKHHSRSRVNESFLVIVITDGQENSSRNVTKSGLANTIRQLQNTDKWTFAFQVPKGDKEGLVKNFNIPEGNVEEWEASDKGLETLSSSHTNALSGYYGARSRGLKAVDTFYTNIPSATQVKRNLVEVSSWFNLYNVSKGGEIRDVVERKTRKAYTKGNAFYQLLKRETVQSYKQVVVMEKKTGKIYAGGDARHLIGIPENQDVKVAPGNHGNFEIFVESTSVNRKIGDGTKVLVRK